MQFIAEIKALVPDYAKDLRLNLDAVITRSTLDPVDAVAVALAAACATGNARLVQLISSAETLDATSRTAAQTAAALMGMNNVWYPYTEMAADEDLKSLPAQLRMQAYATHGGVDKQRFELFALAASIVGKCNFCVRSHYSLLKSGGMRVEQLRDVGRIAAVIAATALVISTNAANVQTSASPFVVETAA